MIYIIAVILHFTFDWILQPRDIAKSKSTDYNSLKNHILTQIFPYIIIMLSIIIFYYDIGSGNYTLFIWSNLLSHGLLDWYLPKLFKPEISERRMINMVAVDQMLHLVILFLSIDYIV